MVTEPITIEDQRRIEQMTEKKAKFILEMAEFVRDHSDVGPNDQEFSKIMLDSLALAEEYMILAAAFTSGVRKLSPEHLLSASSLYKKHFKKE